jgi:hypothetical protein
MQKFLSYFIGFLVLFGLWTVFGTIFNCYPVAAYWGATQGIKGQCIDKSSITFLNASLNIITDFIVIIVPIPLLWNLQIPRKQKMILMGLFGVGSIACITSIVRLKSLATIGAAPQSEQSGKPLSLRA